jgi:thiol:disulfide interchange protein
MRLRAAILIALLLMVVPASWSQAPDQVVTWKVSGPAGAVKASDVIKVKVAAEILTNWHLYSVTQPPGGPNATRFTVLAGPFQISGEIGQTDPKVEFDQNFSMNTETFADAAEFEIPLKLTAAANSGTLDGKLQVVFQVCDDKMCLPPTKVPLPFKVKIEGATGGEPAKQGETVAPSNPPPAPDKTAASQAPAQPLSPMQATEAPTSSPAGTAAEVEKARASGFWPFLWLSMTMGALSLVTPCVFPMIPITVSYFTKKTESGSSSNISLALVYCFGIIFTFTGLGLGLAAVLGATGINQFAANPWVNLVITAVFMGFALNLFGLYQIGVSSNVLTRLSRAGEGGGYPGALLMGLTFTLTSFTCTVPFVGTVLVATAQGDWLWPALGMLGFSTVFAAPFFVLALVPRVLKSLPRSGGWMNSVKVTMGFLEIAAAMKFISNVDLVWNWQIFSREVVLSVWIAIALLATLYLLGKFRLPHDSPFESLGVARMMWAMLFLSIGFYLFTGLMGRTLGELDAFLPPRTAGAQMLTGGGSAPGQELTWSVDRAAAMAQARSEGKPVFIDFTGYTCTNCRWMEANMFPLPAVHAELGKYVRLQLYTDGEGKQYEDNQQYQKDVYGTVALPFYVILDPDGKTLATFPGLTRKPEEFLRFLRSPLERLGAPGVPVASPGNRQPAEASEARTGGS